MHITVAIPTVRPSTLGHAVDSIRRQSWTDWELLVVGQGSDQELPGIGAAFSREDSRIRYLHLPRMGTSYARNAAIDNARGSIVAFIDDDCEADPEWLASIAEVFAGDPLMGVVSGPLLPARECSGLFTFCPSFLVEDVTYDPQLDRDSPPLGFDACGANFAVRRDVAERVGPFDELLGPGTRYLSAEDLDYKLRLAAAGIRMHSAKGAIVRHTYGTRRGLKAVFRHRRAYAIGQGALAGKLALQGKAEGLEWLQMVGSDLAKAVRDGSPSRLVPALLRYFYVRKTYRECLRDYCVDAGQVTLRSVSSPRCG